ncbi:MAG: hypothetical protein Q9P90_02990 [candidate division KSB1 bacterium]|nr:hypothetical protein [candidate division KSB1 bacterium]
MSESRDGSSGRRDSNGFNSERTGRTTSRINDFVSSRRDPATGQTTGLEDGQFLNFISQISPAALVQVLLNKGIVTLDELERAQMQLHERREKSRPEPLPENSATYTFGASQRKRRSRHSHRSFRGSWLKKHMARFRWSRRLGTLLFGWKWKRISKGTS